MRKKNEATPTNQLPLTNDAFKNQIKAHTAKTIQALDKKTLQILYDQALMVYADTSSQLSRKERDVLYEIQQALFGKLDQKLQSSLEAIGQTLITKPDKRKKPINYNLPSSGAVIVKEWKGKKLEVKIVDGGFAYEGRTYKSLSVLAKTISGYGVSGPIFFGLRKPTAKLAA